MEVCDVTCCYIEGCAVLQCNQMVASIHTHVTVLYNLSILWDPKHYLLISPEANVPSSTLFCCLRFIHFVCDTWMISVNKENKIQTHTHLSIYLHCESSDGDQRWALRWGGRGPISRWWQQGRKGTRVGGEDLAER